MSEEGRRADRDQAKDATCHGPWHRREAEANLAGADWNKVRPEQAETIPLLGRSPDMLARRTSA